MLLAGLKSPELHWNTAVSPATGNWRSGYAFAAHQRQQPEEPNTSNQGRLDSIEPWGLSLCSLSSRIWVPSNKGPSCIFFRIAKACLRARSPVTDTLLLTVLACFETQEIHSFQMSILASWKLLFMLLLRQFGDKHQDYKHDSHTIMPLKRLSLY